MTGVSDCGLPEFGSQHDGSAANSNSNATASCTVGGAACSPQDRYGLRMAVGKWVSVALDCSDPAPLAAFWAEMIGGEVVLSTDEFVVVKSGSVALATVRVPDYRPPIWPDGERPKQMHLDLAVDDLDRAQAQAVALGARVVDDQPSVDLWRVMLDPAGHPFCLSAQIGRFVDLILG